MTITKLVLMSVSFLIIASVLFAFGPGGRTRLERILSAPAPLPVIDFQTLKLHERPNQFLVCPEGLCTAATPHMPSPIFDISAEDLHNHLQKLALSQSDVELARKDETAFKYDFIQRTKIMRYPDIVTVQTLAIDENSSTLAIYSRSVFGHSDFGVNEKRVKHWLQELEQAIKRND